MLVSFECETLKSDDEAEEHIRRFMPKLSGLDAVGMLFLPRSFADSCEFLYSFSQFLQE